MTTLYLASGNAHKAVEFGQIFAAAGLHTAILPATAVGGMPEVEETAPDFIGNARIKAAAILSRVPEGAWAMADDSGLQVDALDGAPGVISARYAGPGATAADNNARLMRELAQIPDGRRQARFVCVIVLLDASGREFVFEGRCEGRIALERSGHGGFGYDPLFIPEGRTASFADLDAADKNRISHRGKAAAQLIEWLRRQE